MNQTDPLDEILTTLENVVAHDILLRQSRAKSGRSPKSIHAQAKAAINAEIAKARVEELEGLDSFHSDHILRSLIRERLATLKKVNQNEI